MYSRFVDGVKRHESWNRSGNHRLGHLVNEIAEQGVFLRRAPDNRKGVNRILFAENLFHL